MKKTQCIELLRSVKKNIVSFLAVALIAAAGIAFFLGIRFAAISFARGADALYIAQELADMEIACANGITDEDIAALDRLDFVSCAEGGYTDVVAMVGDDETLLLQTRSLCDTLNQPVVLEGSLPAGPDEAAVEETFADEKGIRVGDVLYLPNAGQLTSDSFRVSAIVNEPSYCSRFTKDSRGRGDIGDGAADYYIMLPRAAFNDAFYNGCFTTAYVGCAQLRGLSNSSEDYAALASSCRAELEAFGKERATLRYDELSQAAALLGAEQAVKEQDWIVLDRNNIGDLRSLDAMAVSIHAISYSMALILLFVAVFVCYASVARMIDEQRVLIGAQKALGFSSGEILARYMAYNGLCAAIASLLGLGGVGVIRGLVLKVTAPNYMLTDFPPFFSLGESLMAVLLCFAVFLLASYLACAKLIRMPAIALLRGETPDASAGEGSLRSGKLYAHMSLYSRILMKNLLSDKGRIITTVVGIVGCMSLLIIAFTLRLAIAKAPDQQFPSLFLYDGKLVMDSRTGSPESFFDLLSEEGAPYTRIAERMTSFQTDGGVWSNAYVMTVPDAAALEGFIRLTDTVGEPAALPEEGMLISRKCAENYDLNSGDTLTLVDTQGNLQTFEVAGVIEHYLTYNLFVMRDQYYTQQTGAPVDACVFLFKGDPVRIAQAAEQLPGFLSIHDKSEYRGKTQAIDAVIVICIVISIIMSLLVLLNQAVMHINKKTRELSVMRVNGFTLSETKAYVYRDSIVLTALGLILGCGVGMGLAYPITMMMEREAQRFVRTPSLIACLLSCLICAAFALAVNLIALRRVDRLRLVNIAQR